MALRQRLWAARVYAEIVSELGGRCVACGATDELSLDHIKPDGVVKSRLEWSWRVSVYRREAAAGLLQVLCRKCNSRKNAREGFTPDLARQPF